MKKIILVLLILTFVVAFAACGDETMDEGKVFETAETFVEITGNSGSISLNEDVARSVLEVYPKESLGLKNDIYDYKLVLSPTRFLDEDACLVEAYEEKAEKPEGTFVILGQQCFVYNTKNQKYYLLTLDGVEEFNVGQGSTDSSSTTEQTFVYDKENNEALHQKFDVYTKEQLGLEKEITEYILVTAGTTTTADDGKTVYVVRLYEKNGEAINHTVSFNGDGCYMFDYDLNKYKKLS